MIANLENPTESTKKSLELISEYSRTADRISIIFPNTSNKQLQF